MAGLLTGAEFRRLCQTFRHTAFRLETHDYYVDEEEQEPLQRFLAGEPPDDSWFMDWYSFQRAREAPGIRLRELRRDAQLTGKQLAERNGWHPSKVSKIEGGKQTPVDADLQAWARSAAGFVTSAPRSAPPPAGRNPPGPDPGDPKAPPPAQHPATPSTRRPSPRKARG